jgi:hypothetical protein
MNSNLPALVTSVSAIMQLIASEDPNCDYIPSCIKASLMNLKIKDLGKDYAFITSKILKMADTLSVEDLLNGLEDQIERTLKIESISNLEDGIVRIAFSDLGALGSIDVATYPEDPPELRSSQINGGEFKEVYGSEEVEIGQAIISAYMDMKIKAARDRASYA